MTDRGRRQLELLLHMEPDRSVMVTCPVSHR
jgi:hypothetical protein